MKEQNMSDEATPQEESSASHDNMADTIADAFDEVTAAEETTEAPDEAVDAEAVETEEITEPEVEAINAPASWAPDEQESFATLDRAVQETISRRETELQANFTKTTQENADSLRAYQELQSAFEPYQQDLALTGMTPAQAANQLLALQRFSTQDPTGYLKHAAQQLGVDLNSLAEDQEFVDPQYQQLQQQIQGLQANIQTSQQQQQFSQQSQLETQVNAFRDEKGADGLPTHPHFEAVRTQMGALLQANPAMTMDAAYQDAVWTIPDVRQKMLDTQQKEKVAKAKAAAGKSPKPTAVAASKETETPKDMKETIGKLFDQATAA